MNLLFMTELLPSTVTPHRLQFMSYLRNPSVCLQLRHVPLVVVTPKELGVFHLFCLPRFLLDGPRSRRVSLVAPGRSVRHGTRTVPSPPSESSSFPLSLFVL